MKLAFCGASGVGKSTIAQMLSHKLNLQFIDHVGYKEWIDPSLSPEEKQRNFEKEYYNLHSSLSNYVSAQSLYDAITYRCLNVNNLDRIVYLINTFASVKYDYVFFIRKEFDLTPEEEQRRIRYRDPEYLINYEKTLLSLLDFMNITYYNISGTVEERYHETLSLIERTYD